MMVASLNSVPISPQEYLKTEQDSSIKHEYRQGLIYAMAGASNRHVLIAGNLFAMLRNSVRGSRCRAFISDTKVHVESINTYYYPDIVISCDQRDRELKDFLLYPCLIVEVLSETTEAFDRGDKFSDYRNLESLQEYVLVSQDRKRVECFRKNAEGRWVLYPYSDREQLQLLSVNFHCEIADLYEDVEFSVS
jgi:Uma2 family endonuclease